MYFSALFCQKVLSHISSKDHNPIHCSFQPNRCYPTIFSKTGAIPQFSAKQVLSHNFLPNRCYPTILIKNIALQQFSAKKVLSHNFLPKRCYPTKFLTKYPLAATFVNYITYCKCVIARFSVNGRDRSDLIVKQYI